MAEVRLEEVEARDLQAAAPLWVTMDTVQAGACIRCGSQAVEAVIGVHLAFFICGGCLNA